MYIAAVACEWLLVERKDGVASVWQAETPALSGLFPTSPIWCLQAGFMVKEQTVFLSPGFPLSSEDLLLHFSGYGGEGILLEASVGNIHPGILELPSRWVGQLALPAMGSNNAMFLMLSMESPDL